MYWTSGRTTATHRQCRNGFDIFSHGWRTMLRNQVSGNTVTTPSRVILETTRACKSQGYGFHPLDLLGFVAWTPLEATEYVPYTLNHRITLGRIPSSRTPRLTFSWTILLDPLENPWTTALDYTWIHFSPTSRQRARRRLLGHQKVLCLPRMTLSCHSVSMLVMLVPPLTLTSTVTASMALLKLHPNRRPR